MGQFMIIKVTKMHGIGNDFILIDDRKSAIKSEISYKELAQKLCTRRFGFGADGMIVAVFSSSRDIGFRIFNSDGSEAEMCGNGIRCFGKYIYEKALLMQKVVNIETKAGLIVLVLDIDEKGNVLSSRVDMGKPVTEASKIPCNLKEKGMIVSEKIKFSSGTYEITAVSMGNPHAVIFTDKIIEDKLFFKLGPEIENSKIFPEKTNVEFVTINSENEISVRVWERGVGETLACGTGACACAVASILNKKTKDSMIVKLKGGDLHIKWNRENNHVYKTGPATLVYESEIDIERIKNDL